MQDGEVLAVAECAEKRALLGGLASSSKRERFVGMGGDHHMIERFDPAGGIAARRRDRRSRRMRLTPMPSSIRSQIGSGQSLDIGAAAAGHRAPLRPVGDPQQAVIVVKADERCRRIGAAWCRGGADQIAPAIGRR